MNIESYIIDSYKGFKDLVAYELECLSGNMFFDLETDSKIEKLAKIHGIGVAFKDNEGFYIQIRDKDKNLIWEQKELDEIYGWVEGVAIRRGIVGHNLLYDVLVLENNCGRDISDCIYSDTILLKHTVDEMPPFALKEVAVKYLGEWADKAQDALYASIEANGGSTNKDNVEMFKADRDILAEYCVHDCVLTLKLFNLFEKKLYEEGLDQLFYVDEVMPLYKLVTIPMKRKGFRIDVPHFKSLQKDIKIDIDRLEEEVLIELDMVDDFVVAYLDKRYPIKRAGKFPKILANNLSITLPIDKKGKVTLSKKALSSLVGDHDNFYDWMVGENTIHTDVLREAQLAWYFEDNPESNSVFNLKSNDHLGWVFFTHFKEKPLHKTPGGSPQCDDDFLDSIKDKYAFVPKLVEYKKLIKLSGTYIDGILDRSIDGRVYPSFLQWGTTSGRYSCASPNLQNMPRQKEDEEALTPIILKYTNAIKKGFIADEGHVLVDLDQSQLEPRCFSQASGDSNLRGIFQRNEDFYSGIAKRVFKLDCAVSEIKKKYPVQRQTIKTLSLAVTYGAEANRIAGLLSIPVREAQTIIDDYLSSYPMLKKYISQCHYSAKKEGRVCTKFGRVRHLPFAKIYYEKYGDDLLNFFWAKKNGLLKERKVYKNALNNSTNFPIQSTAATLMNRGCIAIARHLKEKGLSEVIAIQIHDQIAISTRKEHVDEVMMLAQLCLENTTQLDIPLIAVGKVATNLAESH